MAVWRLACRRHPAEEEQVWSDVRGTGDAQQNMATYINISVPVGASRHGSTSRAGQSPGTNLSGTRHTSLLEGTHEVHPDAEKIRQVESWVRRNVGGATAALDLCDVTLGGVEGVRQVQD